MTDEWQEIVTAPKDGRVVDLTWMEDGMPTDILPMKFERKGRGAGMWVAADELVMWRETLLDGTPTHWRPHRV